MIFFTNSNIEYLKMLNLKYKKELFQPLKEYSKNVDYKDHELNEQTNDIISKNKIITTYTNQLNQACYISALAYTNINLLLFIDASRKKAYDYYLSYLRGTHLLYGLKHIELNKKSCINALYQLKYQHIKNYDILIELILEAYPFLDDKNEDDIINIQLLFLVNKGEFNINETNKKKYTYIVGQDLIDKQMISSIFYCENSLDLLEKQNLKNLFKYQDSIELFHKYKEFVLEQTIDIQHKMMMYSSTVLYVHGLRKNNDIDVYIHSIENKDIMDNIIDFFSSDEIKNKNDFVIKGSNIWPSHWNVWTDEWARKCGALYFEEILGNNNYHFYFCGIKMVSLHVDIQRRLVRCEEQRPASYTDLIMINRLLHKNIKIPQIKDITIRHKKRGDVSQDEYQKLMETKDVVYEEEFSQFKIKKKNDKKKFLNTIKNYLFERYEYKTTIDELKSLLNVQFSREKEIIQKDAKTKKIRIKVKSITT